MSAAGPAPAARWARSRWYLRCQSAPWGRRQSGGESEPGADGCGGGSGEMAVSVQVVGGGGEAGAPGGVVLVPDHAQRVEFGDPVRLEPAGFRRVAHGGDEGAQSVVGGIHVGGGDGEVAVLVAVGLGGCQAEASGAGDGRVAGVEGRQVHRAGDALGVDGEVEVPAAFRPRAAPARLGGVPSRDPPRRSAHHPGTARRCFGLACSRCQSDWPTLEPGRWPFPSTPVEWPGSFDHVAGAGSLPADSLCTR